MAASIDIERLCQVLRDASTKEIVPRFRHLVAGQIRAKTSAIDLVTEADEAAERLIRAQAAKLWPHAVFIGEEGVAADASLLDNVGSADLAIVLDPVDGTANYAAGAPVFAVMAAVVHKGEVVAGIIYDPMGDDWMIAEKGAGAFLVRPTGEKEAIKVAAPVPLSEMVGVVSHSYFELEERRSLLCNLAKVRNFANYRCAGHDYRLAASGHLHFMIYHKLMPWDHLAGSLIFQEAGGYIARIDGSRYEARHIKGGLIGTVDKAGWHELRSALFPVLPVHF